MPKHSTHNFYRCRIYNSFEYDPSEVHLLCRKHVKWLQSELNIDVLGNIAYPVNDGVEHCAECKRNSREISGEKCPECQFENGEHSFECPKNQDDYADIRE